MNNPNKAEMEQFMAAMNAEAKKDQEAQTPEAAIPSTQKGGYNLESFINVLGGTLDGTDQYNVMYFKDGGQNGYQIKAPEDIAGAEAWLAKYDGKHQLYINVNPINPANRVSAKPKDSDILEVRNLYIDIDRETKGAFQKHAATDAEMSEVKKVTQDVEAFLQETFRHDIGWYADMTGNGFRFIIPATGIGAGMNKELIMALKGRFGNGIDTAVSDASRVTGVPGTLNVKKESPEDMRMNRRRTTFPDDVVRVDNDVSHIEHQIGKVPKAPTKTPTTPVVTTSDLMTIEDVRDKSSAVNDLLNGKYAGDRSAAEMALANHLVFYGFTRETVGSVLVGVSQIGKAAEKVASGFTNYVDNTVDRAFADTSDRYTQKQVHTTRTKTPVVVGDTEYDDMSEACEAIAAKIFEVTPWFMDDAGFLWAWETESKCYKSTDLDTMTAQARGIVPEVMNRLSVPIWNTTFKNTLKHIGRIQNGKVGAVPDTYINFINTAYDIENQKRITPTPALFWCDPIPHKLGSSCETPALDRLMEEWITDGDLRTGLLEAMCYPLYKGYPIAALFTLVGEGKNGKSEYEKLVAKLVGETSCASFNLHKLDKSRFESATLYNKRAGFAGDIGTRPVEDTGVLKELSSGDLMGFEFKGKNTIMAKATAKMFMASNKLPVMPEDSPGLFRRMKIATFLNVPDVVRPDVHKEVTSSEFENIAFRAVTEILPALLKRGDFAGFGDENAARTKYNVWSDPMAAFIEHVGFEYDVKNVAKEDSLALATFIGMYNDWIESDQKPSAKKVAADLRTYFKIRSTTFDRETRDVDGKAQKVSVITGLTLPN